MLGLRLKLIWKYGDALFSLYPSDVKLVYIIDAWGRCARRASNDGGKIISDDRKLKMKENTKRKTTKKFFKVIDRHYYLSL